jgi:hypothetical protein
LVNQFDQKKKKKKKKKAKNKNFQKMVTNFKIKNKLGFENQQEYMEIQGC